MERELKFFYDNEGDVLDISVGEPTEAISEEIDDDIFIRIDDTTKEIIGFSILNFTRWFKDLKSEKKIPVTARFSIAKGIEEEMAAPVLL